MFSTNICLFFIFLHNFFFYLVTNADLFGNLSLYKGIIMNFILTILQALLCIIMMIYINILPGGR